ncbi:MAG: hypothetical protein ACJ8CB_33930 [Ktedonobacteraceae bacterium]
MQEPFENQGKIVNQTAMNRGFPHHILLGGVEIVVVGYLVFYVFGHRVCSPFVCPGRSLPQVSYASSLCSACPCQAGRQ